MLFPSRHLSKLFLFAVLTAIVLLTACSLVEDADVEVGFKPVGIPIRISVNSAGEVSLDVSRSFVTPLGVFDAGLVSDPESYFDTIETSLTIRIGTGECIYDLNGESGLDLDLSHDNFRLVRLQESAGNIFIELEGDGGVSCKQGPVTLKPSNETDREVRQTAQSVAEIVANCEGASPSNLQLNATAVISVQQAAVHVNPDEFPPLVRNKYLRQGRTVTIIDGPVCGRGNPGQAIFWKVRSEEITFSTGERGIIVGWIAEESGNVYLLRP
ncbi:MAG: hypothetical protein H6654_01540 [Ardenticatenaceae bacterium]|nr:hypothetical protein [Anaerolineales bacterium]MCB8940867.1 hypothetical protein [Ardenticatenaceae bacterium]MCB8972206.1 hypothetical protein [Ardenticatenaceae bacterium]